MSGAVVGLTKLTLNSLGQERALPTDTASGSVTGHFAQVLLEMIISITYIFTSGFTRVARVPTGSTLLPPSSGGGGGGGSPSGGPGGGGRLSGVWDAARLPPV